MADALRTDWAPTFQAMPDTFRQHLAFEELKPFVQNASENQQLRTPMGILADHPYVRNCGSIRLNISFLYLLVTRLNGLSAINDELTSGFLLCLLELHWWLTWARLFHQTRERHHPRLPAQRHGFCMVN